MRVIRAAILPIAVAALWLAAAFARSGPVPTQPATTPVHVDLSTPQSAARTLFTAVAAGDADGVRQAFYTADPDEAQLASAYAAMIVAAHHLGDAAKEKYGTAADALGRPGVLSLQDLSRLDLAEVKQLDADNATLNVPGQRPMTFRRNAADNTWQLVLRSYAGATPDALPKQAAMLNSLAAAMSDIADRIAAGQYATVSDASQSLQGKLRDVMAPTLRTMPPTSQPKSP